MSNTLKAFQFNSIPDIRIHERTSMVTGKVIYAEDYNTSTGLPGVSMQIEGCPYNLRVLKGSIKGAGNAATLAGCIVTLTGVTKMYNEKEYFQPKDCTVNKQSQLAELSMHGRHFMVQLG